MPTKILIFDKNPQRRKLIEAALDSDLYLLAFARDGREGVAKFEAFKPDFLIANETLDDITGLKVFRDLKKTGKITDSQFILLVREGEEETEVSEKIFLLKKPFKTADIINLLEEVKMVKDNQSEFDLVEAEMDKVVQNLRKDNEEIMESLSSSPSMPPVVKLSNDDYIDDTLDASEELEVIDDLLEANDEELENLIDENENYSSEKLGVEPIREKSKEEELDDIEKDLYRGTDAEVESITETASEEAKVEEESIPEEMSMELGDFSDNNENEAFPVEEGHVEEPAGNTSDDAVENDGLTGFSPPEDITEDMLFESLEEDMEEEVTFESDDDNDDGTPAVAPTKAEEKPEPVDEGEILDDDILNYDIFGDDNAQEPEALPTEELAADPIETLEEIEELAIEEVPDESDETVEATEEIAMEASTPETIDPLDESEISDDEILSAFKEEGEVESPSIESAEEPDETEMLEEEIQPMAEMELAEAINESGLEEVEVSEEELSVDEDAQAEGIEELAPELAEVAEEEISDEGFQEAAETAEPLESKERTTELDADGVDLPELDATEKFGLDESLTFGEELTEEDLAETDVAAQDLDESLFETKANEIKAEEASHSSLDGLMHGMVERIVRSEVERELQKSLPEITESIIEHVKEIAPGIIKQVINEEIQKLKEG